MSYITLFALIATTVFLGRKINLSSKEKDLNHNKDGPGIILRSTENEGPESERVMLPEIPLKFLGVFPPKDENFPPVDQDYIDENFIFRLIESKKALEVIKTYRVLNIMIRLLVDKRLQIEFRNLDACVKRKEEELNALKYDTLQSKKLELYQEKNRVFDFWSNLTNAFPEIVEAGISWETCSLEYLKVVLGLDENLQQEFKDLKSSLERKEEILRAIKFDTVQSKKLELNKAKNRFNNFWNDLTMAYPEIKEASNSREICSLKDLQTALKPDQVVMNYYHDKEKQLIHCQCISKKATFYFKIIVWGAQEKQIKEYIETIRTCDLGDFKKPARSIYKLVVEPAEAFIKNVASCPELIIMPDGILHGIPFDSLLTADDTTVTDWNLLSYLIKTANPNYQYSSTFLLEAKKREENRIAESKLLMITPEYFEKGSRKTTLARLLNTPAFKRFIEKWLVGKAIFQRNISKEFATKENVLANLPLYKYIILYTHSYTDEFGNPQICLVDRNIDKHDISSLNLNAEIVVLASCGNGVGKFIPGEGYDGANRAFVKAGASNVVYTLFDCCESDARELAKIAMISLKNKNYQAALRQAKLSVICRKETNPACWSNFQMIGTY